MLEPQLGALVLLAAAMHASWNAVVKHSGEPTLTFAVVIATGAVYAPFLPFVPLPDAASLPYLAATTVVHHVYYFFLLSGYRFGDLSQVYPIARGTAPLLVALGGVVFAREPLGVRSVLGVSLICAGIFCLISRAALAEPRARRAVLYALATGVLIATYTLCDGLGVRQAGHPFSYVMWGHALGAIPFPLVMFWRSRARLGPFFRGQGARALAGGAVAVAAYSIAVWAMSQSSLAIIASLRETSVIIAAAIGSTLLGEPFGVRRVVASSFVVAGIVVLSSG